MMSVKCVLVQQIHVYHLFIKWTSAITKLTAHFTCGGMMSDLVICQLRIEYGHWSYMTPNVLVETYCH